MAVQLRIRQFQNRRSWDGYQLLQVKRWWGWKTIDRAEVPAHANISRGAFGDTGGWISPFAKYGSFGPDGYIHPQTPEQEALVNGAG